MAAAVYGLCVVQILRAAYSPASFVPTTEDVAGRRGPRAAIARETGPVFTPFHGDLPRRAGKPTFAHAVMISDVIRGGRTATELNLAKALADALRTHQFDAVMAIDARTPVQDWLPIAEGYAPEELVVQRTSRFWRPSDAICRSSVMTVLAFADTRFPIERANGVQTMATC